MRTKINIFILVILLSSGMFTACGGGDDKDPAPSTPTQLEENNAGNDKDSADIGKDDGANTQSPLDFRDLEAFIEEDMKAEKINGLSAFIVKDDKLIWTKGFGKADIATGRTVKPTTAFMLGSVSKVVTGVVLMTLYDQDKFQLDDDINNYLPFKVVNPAHPNEPITFKMLLAHASSIQDLAYEDLETNLVYAYGQDIQLDLGDFLKDYLTSEGKYYQADGSYLTQKPGTKFEYSNIGSALCGYLAEVISGKSFHEYSNEVLFRPLEMQNTGWWLREINLDDAALPYQDDGTLIGHYTFVDYPNGQLRSSAEDMSKFMLMFMNGGSLNGKTILKSSTVDLIMTRAGFDDSSGYGLSWAYDKDEDENIILGHNGAEQGVQTEFYFNPETKVGVMVTANKEIALDGIRDRLLEAGAK